MTAWIGIIGAVIGAIVGGGLTLLNAHLQTRRQAQQDRRKLILTKLEELHEAISHLKHAQRELFIQVVTKSNNADVKQQLSERRYLADERIQMLVGFYALVSSEHLIKTMKASISYIDSMNKLLISASAEQEGGDIKENNFDVLLAKREELEGALTAMQMELENVAKKYM